MLAFGSLLRSLWGHFWGRFWAHFWDTLEVIFQSLLSSLLKSLWDQFWGHFWEHFWITFEAEDTFWITSLEPNWASVALPLRFLLATPSTSLRKLALRRSRWAVVVAKPNPKDLREGVWGRLGYVTCGRNHAFQRANARSIWIFC